MVNSLALNILALVNILIAALNIEVLGIIMELMLRNCHRHINGSSSQSSQPSKSKQHSYHCPYGNYIHDLSTYRRNNYDNDFVHRRNSM